MVAMMYAAFKDPKGAGVVFLVMGLFLLAIGVWFAVAQGGTIPWVLIAVGAFMAGAGGLFRKGIG
jgi:uncharacterized membrane protein